MKFLKLAFATSLLAASLPTNETFGSDEAEKGSETSSEQIAPEDRESLQAEVFRADVGRHAEKAVSNPSVPVGLGEASDWPRRGGSVDNNMVSDAKGVPHDFRDSEGKLDVSAARWVTRLESGLYWEFGEHASLSVADGRVYVGRNNYHPKLKHIQGDRGVLLCLDEKDGTILWQLSCRKLETGRINDREYNGITSTATIEGDRGYILTNRGELVCFDVNGMADGNDGPFTDELNYIYGDDEAAGKVLTHLDADIVWIYDMRYELGASPHTATSGSPLIVGDLVYVPVPNGVDWTHASTPVPSCPALIAIDKRSGELYSEEASGVSSRMVHSNWSTPSFGIFDQIPTVVYGGADGWTYGFHARETESENEGGDIFRLMKMVWSVDCFPPEHRFSEAGDAITYPRAFKMDQPGHSEIIASPVVHGDRIYVALGRERVDDGGNGLLTCIAPGRDGADARSMRPFVVGAT